MIPEPGQTYHSDSDGFAQHSAQNSNTRREVEEIIKNYSKDALLKNLVHEKDQNDKTYATDSEVYYNHLQPHVRKRGPTVRGGGFTVRPQRLTPEREGQEFGSKLGQM